MEEMNALNKYGIWEVVDLPMEKKKLGCQKVFTIKCKVVAKKLHTNIQNWLSIYIFSSSQNKLSSSVIIFSSEFQLVLILVGC